MSQSVVARGASATVALEEQPGSPEWEFAEKVTCTRVFKGPFPLCLQSAPRYRDFGAGVTAGMKVTRATVKGGMLGVGTLTIQYEGPDPQKLPPEECEIQRSTQELALEKAPYFKDEVTEEQLGLCHDYAAAKTDTERETIKLQIEDGAPWSLAMRLRKGFDHYAIFPPVYSWTLYSFLQPVCSAGGFRQVPFGPIAAPADMEWLRQADSVSWTGAHWKLTRQWLGAPEWDHDIYPAA